MALPSLTNAEIVLASPLLIADYIAKAHGGSVTTAYSKAFKGLDDEEIEGAYLCFLNGDNAGIDRIITDYNSTNVGTLTFDPLDVAIDETVTLAIVLLDYTGGVDRAKAIIENDLRKMGYDVNNFLDETQLKELVINKTMSHIMRAKRQNADTDDTYHINYLEFEDLYQKELSQLVASYDENEDGVISDDEEDLTLGQVIFDR